MISFLNLGTSERKKTPATPAAPPKAAAVSALSPQSEQARSGVILLRCFYGNVQFAETAVADTVKVGADGVSEEQHRERPCIQPSM